MPTKRQFTAVVSTKGQMILPAAIRERHHWTAGTRLLIEETPEGILLRTAPSFESRRLIDIRSFFHSRESATTSENLKIIISSVRRKTGNRIRQPISLRVDDCIVANGIALR